MSILLGHEPAHVEGTSIVDPRADGGGEGLITARAGLGGSQNVPAFRAAAGGRRRQRHRDGEGAGHHHAPAGLRPHLPRHPDVQYGASIATGGANVRAIDMAYMNATIAQHGHDDRRADARQDCADSPAQSSPIDTGADYDKARSQALDFAPGQHPPARARASWTPSSSSRSRTATATSLYDHATANDLKKKQVVNAGSVWLLHCIMTDCNARFIIWTCGSSNNDNDLDAFMPDGTKIPRASRPARSRAR